MVGDLGERANVCTSVANFTVNVVAIGFGLAREFPGVDDSLSSLTRLGRRWFGMLPRDRMVAACCTLLRRLVDGVDAQDGATMVQVAASVDVLASAGSIEVSDTGTGVVLTDGGRWDSRTANEYSLGRLSARWPLTDEELLSAHWAHLSVCSALVLRLLLRVEEVSDLPYPLLRPWDVLTMHESILESDVFDAAFRDLRHVPPCTPDWMPIAGPEGLLRDRRGGLLAADREIVCTIDDLVWSSLRSLSSPTR